MKLEMFGLNRYRGTHSIFNARLKQGDDGSKSGTYTYNGNTLTIHGETRPIKLCGQYAIRIEIQRDEIVRLALGAIEAPD
jgi:hypothetical protein